MYLNNKTKSVLSFILSILITINNVNAANPKTKKIADPKLKKEKKIYEELEKLDIFPAELSSIVASYAAPKHILLNFLIPNLNGHLEVSYGYIITDTKEIDKVLKKYPKLKTDKRFHRKGFEYYYTDYLLVLEKKEPIPLPLMPKMVIPIYNIEGLWIQTTVMIKLKIGKDKKTEQEYTFSPFEVVPFIHTASFGGAFSIKLIDDLKTECKDELERVVTSTSDPNVALCIRKIS